MRAVAIPLTTVLALAIASVATPASDLSPDELARRVDALHPRRDDADVAREMDRLLRDGLDAHADDYGLLWRLARLRWWQADGASGDEKSRLGKEGWDAAARAIRVHPDDDRGHYYAGICVGAYAEGIGILRALREGIEEKFNAYIDRAIERAPDIDLGGPYVAKGRYWYDLPWPKRSLSRSADVLRTVIRKHPANLRARLYLAETELASGDARRARETLAPIEGGDGSYDPPEARRIRVLARGLERRIDDARNGG